MEISDFLNKKPPAGKVVELSGIAKGVQEVFLDKSSGKGEGVIHYTGFLTDSDRENEGQVFIHGSIDGYLGEHKHLMVLSMLKASSETNEPVTINGDIIETNPYEIFVHHIRFGKYESKA